MRKKKENELEKEARKTAGKGRKKENKEDKKCKKLRKGEIFKNKRQYNVIKEEAGKSTKKSEKRE